MPSGAATAKSAKRKARNALNKYGEALSAYSPRTGTTSTITGFVTPISRNQHSPAVYEGLSLRDEDDPLILIYRDTDTLYEGDVVTVRGFDRKVARIMPNVVAGILVVNEAVIVRYSV